MFPYTFVIKYVPGNVNKGISTESILQNTQLSLIILKVHYGHDSSLYCLGSH